MKKGPALGDRYPRFTKFLSNPCLGKRDGLGVNDIG